MPDIAPSTCSQMLCSRQIAPIAGNGSMPFDDVVPSVAQTKKGTRPAAMSCWIAAASASGRIANFSSTGTSRRFARPIPATIAAFSIDECACEEVYATSRPSHPFSLLA